MGDGFTIERPARLADALALLGTGDETVRPIAGGTGLTLLMKYGFFAPTTLVSLRGLADELGGLTVAPDGSVRLGAMLTLRDLEDAPQLAARYPILPQALHRLASIRVRNVAQLGGAIAHGHPQMDLPPVLLALEASVTAVSHARGARTIPATELFLGYYETAVEDDELITEVALPALGAHRSVYRKVTARTVDDWPSLGVAVVGRTEDDTVTHLRVAVGALTDRAQRLADVEAALAGTVPTGDLVRQVAEDAAADLVYHDGPAGSVAYQRQLVAVHLRRALSDTLLETAGATVGGN